ncbi:alpha-hydroxy-acid oxidizing protein, partial [Chromohalobacter japonicus]|uniref:alpha-hydroxy-acid oxidizing protein n=1 Tax=Chromohalobacter japonicus TaxID=223900 RepID=UPI003F9014D6
SRASSTPRTPAMRCASVRMIALGADTVLLGRAFIYALATAGETGVTHLLELFEKEMRVAMTLTGARSIAELGADSLVSGADPGAD